MIQLEEFMIPGLVHGFSTNKDGNMGFGCGPKYEVIDNRSKFLQCLCERHSPLCDFNINSGLAMVPMRPGFEETIALVGPAQAGNGMKAPNSGPFCEAMITTATKPYPADEERPGQKTYAGSEFYLALATGDCPAAILYDPIARVLAIVHLSRESTVRRVLTSVLDRMILFGVQPDRLMVGVGPGISQESYELQWFEAVVNDPDWQKDGPTGWPLVIKGDQGGVKVDLLGFNLNILRDFGVPTENIAVSPRDTFTDKRFASHRRSQATGEPEWRHICIAGMVPLEEPR